MARHEPIAPLKVAFFIEGDPEKDFLEALVPRLLGAQVTVRVVRVGGKAAFSSTFAEAAQFVEAGYAAVFVIMDADTAVSSEIEVQRQRLAEVFRRYGLDDRVHVCMAVPMLESWLLAAYREEPESSTNPKRDLARFVGPDADIRKLAQELPLDLARRRARSFDAFVTSLETWHRRISARIADRARRSRTRRTRVVAR